MTKKTTTARDLAVTNRRDPTPAEVEAMDLARQARANRRERVRPPEVRATFQGPQQVAMDSPHSDALGWGLQLMEAFGVDSYAVVERLMCGAGQVAQRTPVNNQEDADAVRRREQSVLSWVSSIGPASTLEATLALQMLAAHEASMKMSGHVHNATTRDALSDYSRMMNQTMRTFAAQVEALQKLRSGGKQQVEVRYVYVDARTQTVVNTGGEQGGASQIAEQPHAPGGFLGHSVADGLPLRGANASRDALSVASGEGASAMPDARREKPGRAARRGERELRGRPLDRGNDSGQGGRAGVG